MMTHEATFQVNLRSVLDPADVLAAPAGFACRPSADHACSQPLLLGQQLMQLGFEIWEK
jgi:hypothetical protein